MNNNIIVISGFSSAGKDKIVSYIANKYPYKMVISTTSRPMRTNESEGNPYHFVSKEEFETMLNNEEFIEYRTYNTLVNNVPDTWYYGVHKNDIDLVNNNYVVVLDLLGLEEFKKLYNDDIISFFINVDEPERKRRAQQGRSDFDLTEWNRRYLDDLKQFTPDVIANKVDHIVDNYDFNKCIKEIEIYSRLVKPIVIVDFDETITKTNEAFIKTVNKRRDTKYDYKSKVMKYNYTDIIPEMTSEEKLAFFGDKCLFDSLEFYENAKETLLKWSEYINFIIVSIGTSDNIKWKSEWIENNLPFINNVILLKNKNCSMDKSFIEFDNVIMYLDDHQDNLFSFLKNDTKEKIYRYGRDTDWNKDWDGNRCLDWNEVDSIISKIIR